MRRVIDAPGIDAVTIMLTRDSVCLADDVATPHEHALVIDARADLRDIAARIAASRYLPMPSDAWGWTIAAGDAVMAIRPRRIAGQTTIVLQGDPSLVVAAELSALDATYVGRTSPWRSLAPPPRRLDPVMLYVILGVVVVILSGVWLSLR